MTRALKSSSHTSALASPERKRLQRWARLSGRTQSVHTDSDTAGGQDKRLHSHRAQESDAAGVQMQETRVRKATWCSLWKHLGSDTEFTCRSWQAVSQDL